MKRAIIVGAGISGVSTGALLARDGVNVTIFEKSGSVGGRTTSSRFRGHILDNGFHIMPFYKTSAVYRVMEQVGIAGDLGLALASDIAFYHNGRFAKYPKGISDMLRLSIVPPRSRLKLLRMLLPMAFSPMGRAERLDSRPLGDLTRGLDGESRSFFDAVCMLAFADTPERVSLGEFVRTMIRANPFRGGTSEFAYPRDGGYDRICAALAAYIGRRGGQVRLGSPIRRVVIGGGAVQGVVDGSGRFEAADCAIVSYPAYDAIKELFGAGELEPGFVKRAEGLDKTTAVIETHFCTSERVDSRQIVFPVGDYAAKGIFFVSNIAPSVSPDGEHLLMAGTPVPAADAQDPKKIKETSAKMRGEIGAMYPGFEGSLLWERPMAWGRVEAVVKEPGMVWKQKVPHQAPGVSGLYFVGDSTISYGIGTDSAAHSSLLCHPKIMAQLAP